MEELRERFEGMEEIEVVYKDPNKAPERGYAEEVDFSAKGFLFHALVLKDTTSISKPVRVEFQRKWVNFDVVAEVRFLPKGAIMAEVEYARRLNEKLRAEALKEGGGES
ncbi:MAG TPA: hypothetical protein EYP65_00830 [Armatimonadetes bacterium]|nr:hypothetical protein [Armatimonadota bacterium]